ncbi:uncharacterized protein DSM5745_00203 [Aspergillus mulundensis]|uniref:Uncharacterized protein n=1 Tax=Aspergillus mulundensis TaxID=1810919 RepID=A0A3D8T356_9EURO|nr:hypothetical protein DSM5745_00203 [Aspergillus mulundensis]RDW92881.1 hypothetical protein DSM5745_00203 [Aspergillus mulundensis]
MQQIYRKREPAHRLDGTLAQQPLQPQRIRRAREEQHGPNSLPHPLRIKPRRPLRPMPRGQDAQEPVSRWIGGVIHVLRRRKTKEIHARSEANDQQSASRTHADTSALRRNQLPLRLDFSEKQAGHEAQQVPVRIPAHIQHEGNETNEPRGRRPGRLNENSEHGKAGPAELVRHGPQLLVDALVILQGDAVQPVHEELSRVAHMPPWRNTRLDLMRHFGPEAVGVAVEVVHEMGWDGKEQDGQEEA